ncbi:MAG TPA: hypothetical protein VJX16_24930 [Terriglobales bacterium]|nr:hypothetical protein [Terriglobales bacterium]
MPFGRGKGWLSSGPASWFLGNWQANYIFQIRSGQPYSLQVTGDVANLKGSAPNIGNYARPNIIADPFKAGPVPSNPDPGCATTVSNGGKAANAVHNTTKLVQSLCVLAAIGLVRRFGSERVPLPHFTNMDFSLFKTLRVRESVSLQMRFEAFNVFNVQNWSGPSNVTINSGTLISKTAGQITGLQGNPRQLQFGLRLMF